MNNIVANREERIEVLRDKFKYTGPVEFNEKNQLIIPGDFDCGNKFLESLDGCPDIVNGGFYCHHNRLTSLRGGPKIVRDEFSCSFNKLISLKYLPTTGYGVFCNNNLLTSLEGAPRSINGHFDCNNNNLTSLLGAPKIVNGSFSCEDNKLTSLTGIPIKINGNFFISVFPDTPLLKILDVIGITMFTFYQYDHTKFEKIRILTKLFKENYGTKNAIMKVGLEMIQLGYGSNARL